MATFKQDMPPPGGYEPVTWTRVPLNSPWSHATRYALFFGMTAVGCLIYKHTLDQTNLEKIELRCSRIALQPMIQAERDRLFLKQLRKNRDYEQKLMKNVRGWEVGKWASYPVYLTLDPDDFVIPHPEEYYAHADPSVRKSVFTFTAN